MRSRRWRGRRYSAPGARRRRGPNCAMCRLPFFVVGGDVRLHRQSQRRGLLHRADHFWAWRGPISTIRDFASTQAPLGDAARASMWCPIPRGTGAAMQAASRPGARAQGRAGRRRPLSYSLQNCAARTRPPRAGRSRSPGAGSAPPPTASQQVGRTSPRRLPSPSKALYVHVRVEPLQVRVFLARSSQSAKFWQSWVSQRNGSASSSR